MGKRKNEADSNPKNEFQWTLVQSKAWNKPKSKKRFQSNPRWPPAPSKIMKQIQVQKNDFKLTLETVMVIGLGHAKPWTMISIKGTNPITKLQESPLLKKQQARNFYQFKFESFRSPLTIWNVGVWRSKLLWWSYPEPDGLKKANGYDGLAITVITWIVMFALHWGLVGCNVCNKGLGGSKSNIQSAGSPNASVD